MNGFNQYSLLILCLLISFKLTGQIDLEDVTSIFITDEFNLNNERVTTINLEIKFKNREPIIFYCDSQSNIAIPWKIKPGDIKNYNPKINWALNKILPEKKSLNKWRLSKNLSDLKSQLEKILKK